MKYPILIILFFFSIISVFAEVLGNNSSGSVSESLIGEWSDSGNITQSTSGIISTPNFHSLRNPFWLSYFNDDSSLLRFVSRYNPLNNHNYAPADLESISGANINEAWRTVYLRVEARDALFVLADAFEKEFHEPLTVISGYRSAAYQKRMWDLGKCTSSLCAPPGYSEHQLGLAVDLFDASTEKDFYNNPRYVRYISWLKDNAHLYGWTQSYQKWVEIDTYEVEPWHWRYVGIPMATRLHDLGWTYSEFVGFQETIQRK